MVDAKFGGQTECIIGNWKIVNSSSLSSRQKTKAKRRNKLTTHLMKWREVLICVRSYKGCPAHASVSLTFMSEIIYEHLHATLSLSLYFFFSYFSFYFLAAL